MYHKSSHIYYANIKLNFCFKAILKRALKKGSSFSHKLSANCKNQFLANSHLRNVNLDMKKVPSSKLCISLWLWCCCKRRIWCRSCVASKFEALAVLKLKSSCSKSVNKCLKSLKKKIVSSVEIMGYFFSSPGPILCMIYQ